MANARRKKTEQSDVVQIPQTKEQKMIRLGNKRVAAALTKIRLIGNLAAYKPTDAQIDQMMEALGEAAQKVEARLRGTRTESYAFKFHE